MVAVRRRALVVGDLGVRLGDHRDLDQGLDLGLEEGIPGHRRMEAEARARGSQDRGEVHHSLEAGEGEDGYIGPGKGDRSLEVEGCRNPGEDREVEDSRGEGRKDTVLGLLVVAFRMGVMGHTVWGVWIVGHSDMVCSQE